MILTLCGSARFEPYWHEANKLLGLAGHISFSLMTFPSIEGSKSWYTDEQKWMLDLAHFAKIQASHGSVFLNIDYYLGESSLRELNWTIMQGKQVYWVNFRNEPRMKGNFDLPVVGSLIPSDGISTKWGDDWNDLIDRVKAKGEGQGQNSVQHQQV